MSDETEEKSGAWETLKDAFKLAGEDESGEDESGEGSEDEAAEGDSGEEPSESDDDASAESDGGSEELSEEEVENPEQADDPYEAARIKVERLEDDPPADISDWPNDQAKYETFGGADTEAYDEGATMNLGPPALRRFPDGSVEVEGEKVDNPEDYKGPPIKGGPTDPAVDASEVDTEKNTKVDQEGNREDGGDEGEGSAESDDDSSGEAESGDAESSSDGSESGESSSEDEEVDSSGEERREQEQTS
ncbi:MAG: hypothetical protein ACR2LY_04110 [Thermoleophilaceae bacterium]